MHHFAGRLFRSSGVGRSLGIYLPTTLAYRMLGLIRGVILAWVLSVTEFGLFQIALLASNVLIPLCSLGWYEGLTRYIPQYESRGSLRRFLWTAVLLAMAGSSVLLGIGWLLRGQLSQIIFASQDMSPDAAARWPGLAGYVLAAVWVAIAYLLLVGTLRGLRMFMAVSALELASNLLLTILAVWCAWAVSAQAEAMLVCYCISYAACALPLALLLRHELRHRCFVSAEADSGSWEQEASTGVIARQMWSFSVWMSLGAIVWQTLQYAPVWYLHRFTGPEVVAVLVGVRLLAQAFHIIGVAIATVVQPAATKLWEEGQQPAAESLLQLAVKLTCLLLFASAAVFVLTAPWILRMFPDHYAQGLPIMALMVATGAVAGELFVFMIHFALRERTHWQLLVWLAGLVSTAALAWWTMHPDEAAAALLYDTARAAAGGSVCALLLAWLLIRMEGDRWPASVLLLMLAPYCLLLPSGLWLAACAITALLLVQTTWLLTSQDKAIIFQRWTQLRESLAS